jgi:hypothetical protein
MKHPMNYTTSPWAGLRVMCVDIGTVIKDERTGREITVDDETMAMKGNVAFVTEKVFESIKTKIPNGDHN